MTLGKAVKTLQASILHLEYKDSVNYINHLVILISIVIGLFKK